MPGPLPTRLPARAPTATRVARRIDLRRVPFWLGGACFFLLAFRILAGDASGPLAAVDEGWISSAVPILGAMTCFVRGRRADGRLAWSLIGAGILAWGKSSIPDAILEKRGPLADDEWRLVRQHSVIGERIVNGAPGLDAVGDGIRSTHERWDGTGYPDRIRGSSIPITARVVAVANAYAAVTSPSRPYARELAREGAVAEIVASAGSALDPRVVGAFVAAMREGPAELAAAS